MKISLYETNFHARITYLLNRSSLFCFNYFISALSASNSLLLLQCGGEFYAMISHFYHQQEIITTVLHQKTTLVISSGESQHRRI